MKVLTATNRTQGWRENDFCYTIDGELVMFPVVECDKEAIDGNCGCRRAMFGLSSNRATTTIEVVERKDIDLVTYVSMIKDAVKARGLNDELLEESEDVRVWVNDRVTELVYAARALPEGAAIERRGKSLTVREFQSREAG